MIEDTSIEDFGREMDRYHRSLGYRLLILRYRISSIWRQLICALTEHKPEPWGGKYWTDYGYEYDGGIACLRCGKELR